MGDFGMHEQMHEAMFLGLRAVQGGTPVEPPPLQPCKDCPWRVSNHGQPHPHDFHTEEQRADLWNGGCDGGLAPCHLSDRDTARMPEYAHLADRTKPAHTCAGIAILQERELMRYQTIAESCRSGGALTRYWHAHPNGLSREGLVTVAAGLLGSSSAAQEWWFASVMGFVGDDAALIIEPSRPNLGDRRIGHTKLKPPTPLEVVEWAPGDGGG